MDRRSSGEPDFLPQVLSLYRQYRDDPRSAAGHWKSFFQDLDDEGRALLDARLETGTRPGAGSEEGAAAAVDAVRALALIDGFRTRGHLEAQLDPLGLRPASPHPELDPAYYGFRPSDMERPVFLAGELGLEWATPRALVAVLRRIYCGTIGVEFMHIQDPGQRRWILEQLEVARDRSTLKSEGKLAILERLTAAESFEGFLHKRYVGTKRFGLDGCESVIPAIEQVIRRCAELGVEDVVIGMAHRGRLNVLANVMEKPLRAIFAEFAGTARADPDEYGSGDVKYHLGTSCDREFSGRKLHLSLTANPSHLEAVNPVVLGKVRAKQDQRGDDREEYVLPLLLHGDAAFAGQGVVSETLDLCEIEGYAVGGAIHVVINNQIGFTTNPVASRTGPYCSDAGKEIQCPIFHVNGDHPESVVMCAGLAAEFRQTFHRDAIVDVFGYRRFGHNEGDEPSFTQPRMYARIAEHSSVRETYARKIVEEGTASRTDVDRLMEDWKARLDAEFAAAADFESDGADWLEGAWSGLTPVQGYDARRGKTAVDVGTLGEIGSALSLIPEGFEAHPKVLRVLKSRQRAIESGEGIDWATAEALAFGSLLIEGNSVRLSGQDSQRGTFSQRHAVLVDQKLETPWVPLNHIRQAQEQIVVLNSPLNEFSVLGFEYGYSLADPRTLVLWEAQFGDFANGAQVIIDQFIASGESKWRRMSGIVLLLPHGYEGQGPEHSSARPERFLQMCGEDNLQIVNCTTPGNYFHVLRRQMHRAFRKPLVVLTPKSLLRHRQAVSRLDDLAPPSHGFHRVMYCDELPSDPKEARQVVLCSGRVYYDLRAAREERGVRDVHLLRIEQLYPFPADALSELLEPYRHCHLVWCQEEPRNLGAWDFVSDLIEEVATDSGCAHPEPRYAGRPTAAAPATGSAARHAAEQAQLIDDALTVGRKGLGRIEARKSAAERRARKKERGRT